MSRYLLFLLFFSVPVLAQVSPVDTPSSFSSYNVPLCNTSLGSILNISELNFWLLIFGVALFSVGLKSDHSSYILIGTLLMAVAFLLVCPNYTLAALIFIPGILKFVTSH